MGIENTINTNQGLRDSEHDNVPQVKLHQKIEYQAPVLINLKLKDNTIHGGRDTALNENSYGLFIS